MSDSGKPIVAVLGAGVMGTQISVALALSGYPTRLYDRNPSSDMDRQLARTARLATRVRKELDSTAALGRITVSSELNALKDAQLVIEAVVESLPAKQAVLCEVEGVCSGAQMLATNTSSLDIAQMGAKLQAPEKLLGVHFFNPVAETELVELILTPKTSSAALAVADALARDLGKEVIQVSESCVNRILIPMINEACRAIEERIAPAEVIDKALRMGANHPIGPLSLADLIGIDVVVEILKSLQTRWGVAYKPAKLLEAMVERGDLGRKSGAGFFMYGKSKKAS